MEEGEGFVDLFFFSWGNSVFDIWVERCILLFRRFFVVIVFVLVT